MLTREPPIGPAAPASLAAPQHARRIIAAPPFPPTFDGRRCKNRADPPAAAGAGQRCAVGERYADPPRAAARSGARGLRDEPGDATGPDAAKEPARNRQAAGPRVAGFAAGDEGRGGRRRIHQFHPRPARQDRRGPHGAGRRRQLRAFVDRRRAEGAGRVRLGQPDRPAARRPRARRRLWRVAVQPARIRRLGRHPRVLRQRRRAPDGHPRPVRPGCATSNSTGCQCRSRPMPTRVATCATWRSR